MILIIDNHDSFTYNLYQDFCKIKFNVIVKKNNEITIKEIYKIAPSHIVISPGPGSPNKSGISIKTITEFSGKIPILGVCLGHQAIACAFNGKIKKSNKIMHGKTSKIYHKNKGIFRQIKNPFIATRYHSLVIDYYAFPRNELEITAWTQNKEIMGIKHKKFLTEGIQFHPESFLTKEGIKILKNFLKNKY